MNDLGATGIALILPYGKDEIERKYLLDNVELCP